MPVHNCTVTSLYVVGGFFGGGGEGGLYLVKPDYRSEQARLALQRIMPLLISRILGNSECRSSQNNCVIKKKSGKKEEKSLSLVLPVTRTYA